MKKLLFTGLLASSALFLLGGCGSSNAMPVQVQQILLKKQVMEEKILISGPFGDPVHEKKLSKKSLRISINHKTRSM